MEKVRDFLNEAGLGMYAEKFEENGWDDFETVLSMTEEDIKTCIDKPGHVRKLLLKLQTTKRLLQEKREREENTLSDNSSSDAGTSVPVPDSETLSKTLCPKHKKTQIESPTITATEQCESMNEAPSLKSMAISEPDEDAANITGNQSSVTSNTANDDMINPDCKINTTHATGDLRTPDVVDTDIIGLRKYSKKRFKTHVGTTTELLSEELANALDSSGIDNNARRFESANQQQAVRILNKSQVQSAINYEVDVVNTYARFSIPPRCTVAETIIVAEQVHQTSDLANKGQMKTILNHHKKKHEQLHVDTRAFQEANFILEDRHWLVIVGNPGDGKTWMGHQLLFYYIKRGYKPVIITSTDDWKRSIGGKGSIKQIALIDDIFGSMNLDDRKVSDWVSVLEDAEALLNDRSGNLMVVCSSRKIIFEAVKSKLSKYKIIEEMRLVDLTSLHKLTPDEINKFLQKYQEYYSVDFNRSKIFPHKKVTHGFPHCVEMFCTNENLRKANLNFFTNPIQFLEKEIDNLYDSESNLFYALVAVLISQNSRKPLATSDLSNAVSILEKAADCCNLSEVIASGTFRKCVKRLENIYIERDDNDLLHFKHPSYAEVVSLIILKRNPDSALDILTIDFLVERTKCCSDKTANDSVVTLPLRCSKKLAKRLTEAMLSNCSSVFRHQAFTCKDFLGVWFNFLSHEISEKNMPLLNSVMTKEYTNKWWNGETHFLLTCLPLSSLEFIIPMLARCEILQNYWSTEKGIQHSSKALKRATNANCSTHVLGCLIDIGAKTVFLEHTRFYIQSSTKLSTLLSAVANGNKRQIMFFVSRGACPCVQTESYEHCIYSGLSKDPTLIEYFKHLVANHARHLPTIERGKEVSLCHLFAERYEDYIVRGLRNVWTHPSNILQSHLLLYKEASFNLHGTSGSKTDEVYAPISPTNDHNQQCLSSVTLTKPDLHRALSNQIRNIDDLRQLIEAGADANLPDEKGRLPLFKAMKQSLDAKILFYLAEKTNDLKVKDLKGRNAFHYLALAKRIESIDFDNFVQLLTRAGCNVNKRDSKGREPVALASFSTITKFIGNSTLQINCNLCSDLPLRLIRSNEPDIITKVTWLRENHISLAGLDKNKRNIAHIVALSSYKFEVKQGLIEHVLKSKEIDINARDVHNITPLMIAIFQKSIDNRFIRFLLDNGAVLEGNSEIETAAFVKCLKNGIEYPVAIVSDALVSSFCNNAKCSDDLMTIFEAGLINLEKLLHFLIEQKWTSAFLLEQALGKLSSNWMHFFYDCNTAKRYACSCLQCFSFLLEAGLDILAFTKDGLCLSWLPENDIDALMIIQTLTCFKVDIQKTFSQMENIESVEVELARRGQLKTFGFVLKNTSDWHWAKSWSNIAEILKLMLDTNKSIDDIPLKRLEQEEQFRKCLAEMAPYVVRKCIEHFPVKLGFARQIFKYINHVLFANDIGNILESAIDAFNIKLSTLLSPEDPHFYWNFYSKHLIHCFNDLMDILMENDMLMDNQDGQGRTSLMIFLQDDNLELHNNSIRKLIDHAQSFHETDCEGKNILHYLAQAKLPIVFKQEIIKLVLQKGAKVHLDKHGRSPLAYILPEQVTPAMILALRVSGDKAMLVPNLVVNSFWTANNSAKRKDDIHQMIQLINHECENASDVTGVTMLAHASRALYIELVNDLLKRGVNPNRLDIVNQSPLHKLLCSEWLLSSNWMIKQLFDINHIEIDLIFESYVLEKCGVSFYQPFLRHLGKDVSEFQQHEFLLDLVNRALGILYQLLENDADPNQMDLMGRSPLHLCAGAFIPDAFVCPAMKMLIAYGADVNLEDFQGVTPLMMCAQYIYTKHRRMNILIEAGASVIAKDYVGNGLSQHSMIGALRRTVWSLKKEYWSETTASQM